MSTIKRITVETHPRTDRSTTKVFCGGVHWFDTVAEALVWVHVKVGDDGRIAVHVTDFERMERDSELVRFVIETFFLERPCKPN